MDLFCITERFMQKNSLMNGIMGISLAVFSTGAFAVTPEGYWKSIDDRTGEQLSIVEIRKKGNDGRYHGKIVYPLSKTHMALHLQTVPNVQRLIQINPFWVWRFYLDLRKDPNKPDSYIDGRVLEPTSGRIYKGKAVVSGEGKRLRMRGYMGVSALGRTVVWIRTDSANP